MATTATNTTAANATEVKTRSLEEMFGKGRYSPAMCELYRDVQRLFGVSADKAEHIAKRFGADVGTIFSNVKMGLGSIKFGKVNDDGKLTLSEAAAKVKNVTLTYPLAIGRAVDYVNKAESFGIDVSKTEWLLSNDLQEWIAKLSV